MKVKSNMACIRILDPKNNYPETIKALARQVTKQKRSFPDDDLISLLCGEVMRLEDSQKNHEEKIKWLDGYNNAVNQNIKAVKAVQQKLDTLLTVIKNRELDIDEPNTVTLEECEKEIIKIYNMLNEVEESKPEPLPF